MDYFQALVALLTIFGAVAVINHYLGQLAEKRMPAAEPTGTPELEVEPVAAPEGAFVRTVTYPPLEPLRLVPVVKGYETELAEQAGMLLATARGGGAYLPAWYVDAHVELVALSVPHREALAAVRQGERAVLALIEREVARRRGAKETAK